MFLDASCARFTRSAHRSGESAQDHFRSGSAVNELFTVEDSSDHLTGFCHAVGN